MPVEHINSTQHFQEVINSGSLVVVDFFATWCGPCKMIAPKFEQFSNQYTDVRFIKVDVDEQEEIAALADVSAMPTFKFYKNGALVDSIIGANVALLENKIKTLQ
ncbi:Thioredoxin-1 [Zancudomyces culisetae]|uniref:Thioredoxin n=1 Tax=Zancudomyces culisetae TaxID=1213189 RepID=A0A1R1PMT9_ZANCU|nr:Thioredoxin-1 [Zancudomyces culisetae]|eukprot:OMH82285.1 Thioredoxin-1 [Zancudomyces culisetae]